MTSLYRTYIQSERGVDCRNCGAAMALPLPEWARLMVPVDMNGAALLLGVSRRFLIDALKQHPHYERRGAKYVFYPEHIATLREELASQESTSPKEAISGMPLARSAGSAYEAALELASGKSPKKLSSGNGKPGRHR
jgi:hypothetical protein